MLVAFLDEYASGLPVAGAADIIDGLHLSTTAYTLAVFAVPTLLGSLIEAPLLAFSDRRPHLRPRFVALGLLGGALGLLVEAWTDNAAWLALGIALYAPCSGLACGVAEGMLVDDAPQDAERRMARWVLFGVMGDIATPLFLWACVAAGVGFREAVLMGAAVVATSSLAMLGIRNPAMRGAAGADEDTVSVLAAAKQALRNRPLLLWLGGTALCSLLDETLAAFTVLWARERFGSASTATAMLVAFSVGAAVGAVAVERLLRTRDAQQLLLCSCVGCALMLVVSLAAPTVATTTIACGGVGLFAAPLYPIAKAQAYRALPGRPGVVNAAGHLFLPLDILAPVLLALCADRFGIVVALALLLAQPLGLGLMAVSALSRRSGGRSTADP